MKIVLEAWLRVYAFISKMYNYMHLSLWKVDIGRNNRFMGRLHIHKRGNSRIIIGSNCTFRSGMTDNLMGLHCPCMFSTITTTAELVVGDKCGFSGTVIGAALSVRLGNGVRCGANTLITDSDWHTDDYRARRDAPVVIEDNVWLGYGVKVLKGVTIERGALVGACSLVTKDIPPYCVCGGVPARFIKFYWTIDEILEHEEKLYAPEERLSREYLEEVFSKYSK